jgi:hypothetical protein
MATGSYEGSLPMEGISGHLKCRSSRSGANVASAASSRIETHAKAGSPNAKRGWRQRCQRLDRTERRGKKTPTLAPPAKPEHEVLVRCRSAEATAGVVKRLGPRSNLAAPETAGCPHGESRGSEPGSPQGAGAHTSFGWQMSIGRIARLCSRGVARLRGSRGR